ncbi:MAG: nicotinate (nicotinamide) nucleotide adenylyltransferase [Pseudomonadota bacterium]|nr:nicotinate (nicotinamide) nucleotide adenylyltransferase [Pseudomonadota bacterium]MED5422943.1 nicotinate (nicotinamide) nucleotide adenylyltransferase [Pseudomonadota bacterium]MEE3322902.1 nicotinate (nicotinamide) nucleotide adenylyltransferase [Pseudomonadota bacterium]
MTLQALNAIEINRYLLNALQNMHSQKSQLFTAPKCYDSERWKNMRIGILGGSFNPPHEGHVYVSEVALKRLKLDAVWWIVTPQNPFKTHIHTASFEERMDMCHKLVHDSRIVISDLEQRYGLYRTIDSVKFVKQHYPHTKFVWLTGMDLVAEIPKWRNWTKLLDEIAFAHIIRPPTPALVRNSPIRQQRTQTHIYNPSTHNSSHIDLAPRKTYWILDARGHKASSTEIRAKLKRYKKS